MSSPFTESSAAREVESVLQTAYSLDQGGAVVLHYAAQRCMEGFQNRDDGVTFTTKTEALVQLAGLSDKERAFLQGYRRAMAEMQVLAADMFSASSDMAPVLDRLDSSLWCAQTNLGGYETIGGAATAGLALPKMPKAVADMLPPLRGNELAANAETNLMHAREAHNDAMEAFKVLSEKLKLKRKREE